MASGPDGLQGVVQLAGSIDELGDDDDGETVQVDRRMVGIFEIDNAELELVDQGALRDEEVFSLDSEPRVPLQAAQLPPADPQRIDWWLIGSAASGGLFGAVAAVWWVIG